MNSYSGFAQVYDTFMDNVPYEEWCERIVSKLKEYGLTGNEEEKPEALSEVERNLYEERHTILDLGCGTGKLTRMLADKGYSMIGVDLSDEMLQIAREAEMEKAAACGLENTILYLQQDMRRLELFGTVGAVVSVCDSINYLLEEKDLTETFLQVNNYLYPGGIFIFDFNTVHKYRDVLGDRVIAENRPQCSFIWENFYFPDKEINQYELTIFVKAEEETFDAGTGDETEYDEDFEEDLQQDLFIRMKETHYQRGYTLEQIKDCLEQAGMILLEAFDADTNGEVIPETERILVVAKEHGNRQRVIEKE
ncbi:MAG: class I SAM-dependent methyltransferase [Lachnospiraceae bacterium]|jgi:SAM-dependent methyltransferase|nr:class I SAM-dependent methyltransferase [Lachnospiraceae bacterium]